jgi:hypothetical protein
MSKKGSPWEEVFEQLQNPWDWAAATVGAAGGAAATIFLHGADLGHSIPAGALGTVGARKAVVASFRRNRLSKRARNLLADLKEHKYDDLTKWLKDSLNKWEKQIIDSEEFEARITLIADEDSERYSGIPLKRKFTASAGTKAHRQLPKPQESDREDSDEDNEGSGAAEDESEDPKIGDGGF